MSCLSRLKAGKLNVTGNLGRILSLKQSLLNCLLPILTQERWKQSLTTKLHLRGTLNSRYVSLIRLILSNYVYYFTDTVYYVYEIKFVTNQAYVNRGRFLKAKAACVLY